MLTFYLGLHRFSSKKSSDWSDLDKLPRYPRPAEDDDYNIPSSKPSRSSRVAESSASSGTDEAQKKFGNAKAISSDQFFGDSRDNDVSHPLVLRLKGVNGSNAIFFFQFERRTNLSRFDGKSSISSADYFGDGQQRNQQSGSSLQNTLQVSLIICNIMCIDSQLIISLQNVDLDDVKESVRQGVTKVAGRITNLANGVMSSLQEKYGY
jgi:ADP-ribosylation factor GTPase-activating protein 2/3